MVERAAFSQAGGQIIHLRGQRSVEQEMIAFIKRMAPAALYAIVPGDGWLVAQREIGRTEWQGGQVSGLVIQGDEVSE